jgi:hypothetical protein
MNPVRVLGVFCELVLIVITFVAVYFWVAPFLNLMALPVSALASFISAICLETLLDHALNG